MVKLLAELITGKRSITGLSSCYMFYDGSVGNKLYLTLLTLMQSRSPSDQKSQIQTITDDFVNYSTYLNNISHLIVVPT